MEQLKERAWQEVAAIDRALAEGRLDEPGWHAAMADLVRPAYLAANNPYAQAGHGGDAASWEASRGFLAAALHRSGTILDVGCAGGIMMESLQRWGAAKGLALQPHGLEIVPELAELARRRLPQWHERIYVGNIRTWEPSGQRFDLALVRPEYAPQHRRAEMARHILDRVLTPNGRLIVFVGAEEVAQRRVEASMAGPDLAVHGRVEVPHPGDTRLVRRLFWMDGQAT